MPHTLTRIAPRDASSTRSLKASGKWKFERLEYLSVSESLLEMSAFLADILAACTHRLKVLDLSLAQPRTEQHWLELFDKVLPRSFPSLDALIMPPINFSSGQDTSSIECYRKILPRCPQLRELNCRFSSLGLTELPRELIENVEILVTPALQRLGMNAKQVFEMENVKAVLLRAYNPGSFRTVSTTMMPANADDNFRGKCFFDFCNSTEKSNLYPIYWNIASASLRENEGAAGFESACRVLLDQKRSFDSWIFQPGEGSKRLHLLFSTAIAEPINKFRRWRSSHKTQTKPKKNQT